VVSTTTVINLSPVLTTPPIKENPWQRVIAGVVDTTDKHSFAIISANFRQILNDPTGILRGPGDTDS
jgi:hypothetical protein